VQRKPRFSVGTAALADFMMGSPKDAAVVSHCVLSFRNVIVHGLECTNLVCALAQPATIAEEDAAQSETSQYPIDMDMAPFEDQQHSANQSVNFMDMSLTKAVGGIIKQVPASPAPQMDAFMGDMSMDMTAAVGGIVSTSKPAAAVVPADITVDMELTQSRGQILHLMTQMKGTS